MSTTSMMPIVKELASMLPAAAGFWLILSGLYQYGFFTAINVSILDYFQVSDYFTTALSTLPFIVGMSCFGALVTIVWWKFSASRGGNVLPTYWNISFRQNKWTRRIRALLWWASQLLCLWYVWIWFIYPDMFVGGVVLILSIPILWLAGPSLFPRTYGSKTAVIIFACSFIASSVFLGGYQDGRQQVRRNENAMIFFKDEKREEKLVNLVRILNSSLIYTSKGFLVVESREDIRSIVVGAKVHSYETFNAYELQQEQ